MAIITTHPGGPYYNWRVSAVGSPPPHTFDENADAEGTLYHDWQHGVPKDQALTHYFQRLGIASAGLALVAVAAPAPAPAAPVPAPPPRTQPVATVAAATDRAIPTQYGYTLTREQIQVVDDIFNVGLQLKAPRIAFEAMYYAIMGESNITDAPGGGWFQTSCNLSAYNGGSDHIAQARGFLTGGECFHDGGAIRNTGGYRNAWQIANAVEDNAVWNARGGDSYARGGFTTAQLTAEAQYAVSYFLPGLATGPAVTLVSSPARAPAGGVFDTFKALNWAGDYENRWKDVLGGSNEAANMAKLYNRNRLEKITTIGWQ